ncbi:MAG: uroporphyrinogen decarboxylase family protein [Fimbriimonadales bacterium]
MATTIDKREAVLGLLDRNAKQTYIPAGFFLHFEKSCHTGQAAIDKHKEFFRFTGMDFVKVQLELDFPTVAIEKPQDWANLPFLDTGFFEPQLGVVRGLVEALGKDALVIVTLYSPMMMANHIGDRNLLNAHLEEDVEAVRPGMQTMTDSLIGFVRECVKAGVDGFYHSTQGGEDGRFSDPSAFDLGVKPYDLEVMREIERTCRFNILHICDYNRDLYGGYSDLTRFFEYPGHVVNCALEDMNPELVAAIFRRPFMGGMDRCGALATGSEAEVRTSARSTLSEAPDRFILGADCTVPANTSWENLRAAIDEAHRWMSR